MDTLYLRNGGKLLSVLACAVTLTWSASATAAPGEYSAANIGPFDHISAMNEHAEVVGWTTAHGAIRAMVAGPDIKDGLLPLPEKMVSSRALDINEWGEIVGTVSPSDFAQTDEVAVVWLPSTDGTYEWHVLGTLAGDNRSVATAINNLGDIVGYSANDRSSRAVLFTVDRQVVDLSATGVRFPSDINDKRIIIDGSPNGSSLDLKTMTTRSLAPSVTKFTQVSKQRYGTSVANAINESNQVAGTLMLSFDKACRQQAARYAEASGWESLSACGLQNAAWDINNAGDVLMEIDGAVWVYFEGAGSYPLSDLVQSDERFGTVVSFNAGAVNDAGQIAVTMGDPLTGEREAVLFTPRSFDLEENDARLISDLAISPIRGN